MCLEGGGAWTEDHSSIKKLIDPKNHSTDEQPTMQRENLHDKWCCVGCAFAGVKKQEEHKLSKQHNQHTDLSERLYEQNHCLFDVWPVRGILGFKQGKRWSSWQEVGSGSHHYKI